MGIDPAQFRQMEERLAVNRAPKRPAPSAPSEAIGPPKDRASISFVIPEGYNLVEFNHPGKPLGKPRMTQGDKFKRRPCVQRYWDFKDAIRKSAGSLPLNPDMILITAWVSMPPSWSEKKKSKMVGQPCRQSPDFDNICKAGVDALFDQDAGIWMGATTKYWCRSGEERLNVKIFYAKSS